MKKILAFMLVLVSLFYFSGCDTKSMNYIIENKPSVIGTVEEVHENYIIMYSDSAEGYPYAFFLSVNLISYFHILHHSNTSQLKCSCQA